MQGIYETKCPTKEQIKKYKRSEAEIDTKNIYANNITKYARSDIMEKMIKNCRGVKKCNGNMKKIDKEKKRKYFWSLLGLKENDVFLAKEFSIIEKFKTIFSVEEINLQHNVLGYKIDVYFFRHKLVVGTDEFGHPNRDIEQEIKRNWAVNLLGLI